MYRTGEMILDFVDELVNGVLKKGYLVKQGHVRHNWKKRYFILKENVMSYYKSRETMEFKVCGWTHKCTNTHLSRPTHYPHVTCAPTWLLDTE